MWFAACVRVQSFHRVQLSAFTPNEADALRSHARRLDQAERCARYRSLGWIR
jgi:hypothetical protein